MTPEESEIALTNGLSLPELITEARYAAAVTVPDVVEALDDDIDGLALLLRDVLNLVNELREAGKMIEHALGSQLVDAGHQKYVVQGLGEIETTRNASRSAWESDELRKLFAKALVARKGTELLIDPSDGAMRDPLDVVITVLAKFSEVNGNSWKPGYKQSEKRQASGLRAWGIDPDEYCETRWSDGVKMPRADVREDS